MKPKRTGKQYLIINEKKIRVRYGVINRLNPSVIFIRAKGDVRPVVKLSAYGDIVAGFKRSFPEIIKKHVLKEEINPDKCLFNTEISDNSLVYNKPAHIRYEVFIKPVDIKPMEEYEEKMKNIATGINDDIKAYFNDNGIHAF